MKWIKVVERRGQSVLISSYFYNGIQTKYFQKLGLLYGIDNYKIVDYINYYTQEEVERFINSVIKMPITKFKKILEKLYQKASELISFATANANSINLEQAFMGFSDLCLEFGPSMYFPILTEKIIEEKIQRIVDNSISDNKNEAICLFTSSHKPTDGTRELLSLFELTSLYKSRSPDLKYAIRQHLFDYGWISYTKFVGEPWTEATIKKRIKDVTNPEEQASAIIAEYQQNESKTKKLIKENKISREDAELIWFAKELAYFRTYRLDTYTKAGFIMHPLICNIAKNVNLNKDDLVFLTYQEILESMQLMQNMETEIKRRKENRWQMIFDRGHIKFQYDGFEIKKSAREKTRVITGRVACQGYVKGPVRIIRGVLEFHKMQTNDILVTSMTTPDFVPLMERCAAIVTDEGGITCHAAIVAREMRKPCVIGTEVATTVLKDGDIVEVDANKGTVRRIT